jgi:hypothetical protein
MQPASGHSTIFVNSADTDPLNAQAATPMAMRINIIG